MYECKVSLVVLHYCISRVLHYYIFRVLILLTIHAYIERERERLSIHT